MLSNQKKVNLVFTLALWLLSMLVLPLPDFKNQNKATLPKDKDSLNIQLKLQIIDSMLAVISQPTDSTQNPQNSLDYFSTQSQQLSLETKSKPVGFAKPLGYQLAGRVGEKGVFILSPQGQKTWVEKGDVYENWSLYRITEQAAFLRRGGQVWEVNW